MRWMQSLALGSWVCGTLWSGSAAAFTYEVLFEETLSRDAATLGRARMFAASYKSVLIDGKVETTGTDAVTFDRLVISSLRLMQQIPITANASLRLNLPIVGTFQKQEGQQVPRIISEATWLEAKPRLEFVFATQNSLDIILGLNLHIINGYDQSTESANFTANDRYDALSMNYGHIAVVKHGAGFDGGFSFQLSGEKTRKLSKSTSIEEGTLELEDRVYSPTTITIFANIKQGFGDVYGEFSAIEASGGGNLTDNNVTVREDYFRMQFSGVFPLMGKSLSFEPSVLYKSLAYADNRNVTLDTIPMYALHLKLGFDLGVPAYAGLIGVRGTDGQSLEEFNANYQIVGVGAVAGMSFVF